ncbi:hypothetical protein AB0F43_05960 [Kribbella sp. NPDC023972]|uniref:hypothetical protein n=1 Tax=Kribbella sp. NPDC023972 TaxID=3154795 RepID=UPI0033ED90FF
MGRNRGVFAVVAAVSAVAAGGVLGLGFVSQAGATSSTTSTTTTTSTYTAPTTTTTTTTPPGGEFCTPGFWKNNPGAVAETGVDMTQSYNALFDPDVNGTRKGGVANPTLQQVLDNPQHYGGEAANNVAALLSDAHPDVDFTGERTEDTCPLDADESQ